MWKTCRNGAVASLGLALERERERERSEFPNFHSRTIASARVPGRLPALEDFVHGLCRRCLLAYPGITSRPRADWLNAWQP